VPTFPDGRTSSTITNDEVGTGVGVGVGLGLGVGVGAGVMTVQSSSATEADVAPSLTVARQLLERKPEASTRSCPDLSSDRVTLTSPNAVVGAASASPVSAADTIPA
jgi:hypothetical protein